jgi:dienelactone hydrolase
MPRRADTLAALAWVRLQTWVDTKRNNIASLGWSHGGIRLLATTDANHNAVKSAEQAAQRALSLASSLVH